MASRRSSENYDALGGIFDFIFKEAKKKPEKRQAIKASGIAGETLFGDALASTLENPGVFISDTILNDFNDSLDLELATFNFEDQGKVKISTKNVVDFIKDPTAFVDKVRTRAEGIRKGQRARFVGGFINDYLTTAWAYKYGNEEAQSIALANSTANEKKESYKIARAVGQNYRQRAPSVPITDYDFMAERSVQLIGRGVFGQRWDSMNTRDKDEFTQLVSGLSIAKTGSPSNVDEIKDYLNQKYSVAEVTAFDRITSSSSAVTKEKKINIFDPNFYKELERGNLNQKINALRTAPAGSQGAEKRRMYEKMKLVMERDQKAIAVEISNLSKKLSSTTDPKLKGEIRREIKDLNRTMRIINGDSLLGQVGRVEGFINSINTVGGLTLSNVVPGILNGDFFDPGKNTAFNPLGGSGMSVGNTEILVAKKSNSIVTNAYNKFGENLYYVTPRSLLKTAFYNGEGFARLLYNNLNDFQNVLGGKGIDDILMGFSKNMMGEKMKFDLSNGSIGNIDEYVSDILDQVRNRGGLSQKELEKFEKMLKSSTSLKRLTNNFSFFARSIDKIRKKFTDVIVKKSKELRRRFAAKLLQNSKIRNWLIKSGGSKLLGQWIVSGGIKTLVQSLVTAIAGAVGMVGTPIGSIIVTALTWIATDLLMRLLKIVFEFGKLIALGILALLLLFVLIAGNAVGKFNKRNYAYSNATPGSVISCSLYNETPIDPVNPPWGPVVIPPRTSQECVLGSQGIHCSQGYIHVAGWSHSSMTSVMPVDLTNVEYIYAPQFCDTGDCSITAIREINCGDGTNAGGVVILEANDGSTTYTFKLLHVQPLANLGDKLSGGQPVAVVQSGLEVGNCWTGKHLHLETRQNGQVVDPMELLQSFNCNVPDETGCQDSK